MKAIQGISHSYSHLNSAFFFSKSFLTLAMLFYSGLESKNKQNTDNIKALQVTFYFQSLLSNPGRLQVLSFIFACFY